MPKKPTTKKQKTQARKPTKVSPQTSKWNQKIFNSISGLVARAINKAKGLLARRPHRSFRRTRRRDYVRPLKLSGYWAFTRYVCSILWSNKKLFFGVVFLYGLLNITFAHFASQETYEQLSTTLKETGGDVLTGEWGAIGGAAILLVTGVTGNFNTIGLTEDQKALISVLSTLVALLIWLTTVWLLRAVLAGQKPKLRQGLYNSGAPIFSTFLVFLVLIIQLLPFALAVVGLASASSSGLLDGGVEAMVLMLGGLLLIILSLYWVTSTIMALVLVTLPGMYPMRAIKTAGDLVIGRRLRILLRFLWWALLTVVVWALIVIPIILLDSWLKGVWPVIADLPIVPVTLLIMGSFTIVWSASYIYLLYRKVVEDDTSPV
jgi:hypothetical protein